jgi:hypothetical protein
LNHDEADIRIGRARACRDYGWRRTAACAETARPGRKLPAWLHVERLVLHAVERRTRRDREAAERRVSVRLDVERFLLPTFGKQPMNPWLGGRLIHEDHIRNHWNRADASGIAGRGG